MIVAGFTGQLRGWWDNYLTVEERAMVINAQATDEGVDNLGMALVANREDVVYTLILTILEHFNGRFTNQNETVRTLLNGLRCKTLGDFRWYKDTFMSRVMKLPENKLEHWKAKFIDGLPPLFAEREKIKIISENIAIDICAEHPSAFWNRKKHIVTLPYEDNFSEDYIPTKSRPCQMNAELVEFCKKEIDNLLQKGLIKPSKSPWSCTAFCVNNAAEKERGIPRLIIETDASNIGYGGILKQINPNNKHEYLIRFFSGKWSEVQ
ncbi:uncharacterized protein [Nicotiana tomentosiformis]|uniref:uncharacterized protein n=1 Tax=Nicotiana tomentosiformis TaxID=4098 RepID=UPI00388C8CBD